MNEYNFLRCEIKVTNAIFKPITDSEEYEVNVLGYIRAYKNALISASNDFWVFVFRQNEKYQLRIRSKR